MLLSLKKHYVKNFKNFIISQYLITFKQLFFNKLINIKISFSNKTFFLASFLVYTFCILKFRYNLKKNSFNIFLPILNFFFIFNTFFYPFLVNNMFFKKTSKSLVSFKFLLFNFFLILISFFFYKNFCWLENKNIEINITYYLKKSNYKYIQFMFNFFQIPIFLKLS